RVRDLAGLLQREAIDIVYDRTYHMTLVTAAAVRATPAKRVSVIVTDPQLDFEGNVERWRSAKRLLLRRAYQTADRVVAVSEGVRKAAVDYYQLLPEKTATIYNLFDVERIDRLAAEPLPESAMPQPERLKIVAAGRL